MAFSYDILDLSFFFKGYLKGHNGFMLILVSTPIGNLGDFSERAKETLRHADIIACEDTRVTRQLLTLTGIEGKRLIAYHEHNADRMRPALMRRLKEGATVALVSDAGTPLVSDPGYKLVRACHEAGVTVTTIPGANAVLSALQLSGLPSDAFFFKGFLPVKSGARRDVLLSLKNVPGTLIFYETPNRLLETLQDMEDVLGDRPAAVVREITKKFEETRRGTCHSLRDFYQSDGLPKGELVLVVGRAEIKDEWTPEAIDRLILKTLETNSVRDTVKAVCAVTGQVKAVVYKRVLELK